MTPEVFEKRLKKLEKRVCCLFDRCTPSTIVGIEDATDPDITQTDTIQFNNTGDVWYVDCDGNVTQVATACVIVDAQIVFVNNHDAINSATLDVPDGVVQIISGYSGSSTIATNESVYITSATHPFSGSKDIQLIVSAPSAVDLHVHWYSDLEAGNETFSIEFSTTSVTLTSISYDKFIFITLQTLS